ncbi:MAG: hypothetical protein EBS29_11555, partial [Chloroflexia bacterium]|nr:hypothetical protein [Chloroflexia bacterium]
QQAAALRFAPTCANAFVQPQQAAALRFAPTCADAFVQPQQAASPNNPAAPLRYNTPIIIKGDTP